jgi:hypothetical protein
MWLEYEVISYPKGIEAKRLCHLCADKQPVPGGKLAEVRHQ